ncbi:DUF1302 domain-containing protein [Alcanivorax quisquiliarum]|uniref:DUF1302 domain-containing protein n=1 Tax=Alcanivorax quisquiliarum TaxID=2933565 RepID=A0ABT0E4H6_9GAMM|nr:DUF1302 domain-containing protein [Alcanivorax quisquiliarum]MCK0536532.1 DUF1302 domain-containing protein [Alcanivorax quisquiliarum]
MKNKTMLKKRLATAIASASLATALGLPAHAFELQFDNPNISGRLDTDLSLGAMWRTEGQDRMLAATDDIVYMSTRGYSTQINKNDANNNYDTGLASLVGKATSELALDFGNNYGLFARGTTFYDHVIMDGGHDGGALIPGGPVPGFGGSNRYALYSDYANNGAGDRFTRAARRNLGQRSRMLDAYVWGEFQIADRPLLVRAGRQVINWGEALFMQNGINSANYIDLAALRQPGAEIKEALLPLGSIYFSYGLTNNLTAEAFYQYEWKNTEDAPVGTFYSTNDAFPGKGASNVVVDGRLIAASAGVPAIADAFAGYTMATYGSDYQYEATQVTVSRAADEEAGDSGQFGIAARYFADALNGTEFGFYYTRTHAKLPVVGARLNSINLGGGALGTAAMVDDTEYMMVYGEDIDMFGFSFSSNIGTMALSGEIAYRPKQPIINEVGDNLIQNLAAVSAAAGLQGVAPTIGMLTNHCVRARVGGSCLDPNSTATAGQYYYFYDEAKMTNASLVSIFSFGPMLGTDGLLFLLELGAEHAGGLDRRAADGSRLYYNSTAAIQETEASIQSPDDVYKTYLDRFSWGYRAALRATYNDLFAGIAFAPSLSISHDVRGNSVIGGNFMEDRKAATLGLNFVYRNNLELGVQATSFWGAGYSNKLRDRDNAAISVRYSF